MDEVKALREHILKLEAEILQLREEKLSLMQAMQIRNAIELENKMKMMADEKARIGHIRGYEAEG